MLNFIEVMMSSATYYCTICARVDYVVDPQRSRRPFSVTTCHNQNSRVNSETVNTLPVLMPCTTISEQSQYHTAINIVFNTVTTDVTLMCFIVSALNIYSYTV